jgi:transketolase
LANNSVREISDELAIRRLKKTIVDMVIASGEGHIPSSFSILDILFVVYKDFVNTEKLLSGDPGRDVFILSKGHGAAALYAVLNEFGILADEDLGKYSQAGGKLGGHPDSTKHLAFEASTGSLGHGLPIAVGVAMAKKIRGLPGKVFCLIGDGESQEGTTWEAALVAANQHLDNLIVIVDFNQSGMQLNPIENLQGKWQAFGWDAQAVDGHSHQILRHELSRALVIDDASVPHALIAKTVKGNGVVLLEGHGKWHHRIPNATEYEEICAELGLGGSRES